VVCLAVLSRKKSGVELECGTLRYVGVHGSEMGISLRMFVLSLRGIGTGKLGLLNPPYSPKADLVYACIFRSFIPTLLSKG
jgi:hypothetical protein